MVTTRRSETRSSPAAESAGTGSKRSGTDKGGPAAKAQKTEGKHQATLEETMQSKEDDTDTEMADPTTTDTDAEQGDSKGSEGKQTNNDSVDSKKDYREEVKAEPAGDSHVQDTKNDETTTNKEGKDSSTPTKGASDAVHTSSEREAAEPSSILEKGLIYFFFRARVGVDEPSSASDVVRSYIVLRPFPRGAALGEGAAKTPADNNRVLALPKKVLPRGPKDRFMVFVEHAGISPADVEAKVLRASDYSTQTAGTRHAPSATLVGEGVYALTETGDKRSETHLAYILTLPDKPGDVQHSIGLAEQGSFVFSAKNPTASGPASAQLPKGPDFPKSVLDHFGSLRWCAAKPEMLDYENAQFLLIGTDDDDLAKATKVQDKDDKEGKEEPKEELEKLEAEDEVRVEKLHGDHAVFADLGVSRKAFEGLKTTWQGQLCTLQGPSHETEYSR